MTKEDQDNHFQLIFDGLNEDRKERNFNELIAGDYVQCFKDQERFTVGNNYRVKWRYDFDGSDSFTILDDKMESHVITEEFFDKHFIGWAA